MPGNNSVYVLSSDLHPRVKIGWSSRVPKRIRELALRHGPLTLAARWDFVTRREAEESERSLHWHFRDHHVQCDWTDLGEPDQTEWFTTSVLHFIETLNLDTIVQAYRDTRVVEVRLPKLDLMELRDRGLTIEDCVNRVVGAG